MSRARKPAAPRREPDPPMYSHPVFLSPAAKAIWPIKFRIQQIHEGRVWTSAEDLTAESFENVYRACVAGFLFGSARWAIDQDGLILCGLDGQGNRYTRPEWPSRGHSNLESIRAYALANGGAL